MSLVLLICSHGAITNGNQSTGTMTDLGWPPMFPLRSSDVISRDALHVMCICILSEVHDPPVFSQKSGSGQEIFIEVIVEHFSVVSCPCCTSICSIELVVSELYPLNSKHKVPLNPT